ncbi:ATP-binding cassette domain-containing protein [Leucobacter japonicus]|uniref:ATP-binding cassette domain-containing protein n=1 Tax=Leucobacter japonicus TaxID=1461259 RepID=UPI000AF85B6D|nr:ATP-binding cassette domain-containing protein [Leucobacter japonicus]
MLGHAGFHYTDEPAPALSDIDLVLHPGEMLAVLGPQGAGTSTLSRLAAGLLADRGAASGTVALSGSAAMLGDDPEAQLTGMTSFVDDEVRLPVRLSGSTRPVDVGAALEAFGMARLSGRRLDALSGGERQLVALASLMTLDPAVLVLDQPALSLDPSARLLLRQALARFCARGGAVLLAGHQYDELAAAADRVDFLRAGRLVSGAAPAEVDSAMLTSHGVWNALGADDPAPERMSKPAEVIVSEPASVRTALRVHDLTVERDGTQVLDGVDLDVAAGHVLAVVGANGAGKSTLLRAVAGLLERFARVTGLLSVECAVAGGIGTSVDGTSVAGTVHELGDAPASQRAGFVGWVGQDPGAQLSAATVSAELERAAPLPRHRRRDRAGLRAERAERSAALLERVGLASQAAEHPYDLTPDQRKDLVIASALLLEPGVLLLDEPTLGRDLAGMRRLERIITDVTAAGGAVVLTTHDLRWATQVATRVQQLPIR